MMQQLSRHQQSRAANHRLHIIEYAITALAATTLLVTRHNNPYIAGALFVVVLIPAAIVTASRLLTQPSPAFHSSRDNSLPRTPAGPTHQAVAVANRGRTRCDHRTDDSESDQK